MAENYVILAKADTTMSNFFYYLKIQTKNNRIVKRGVKNDLLKAVVENVRGRIRQSLLTVFAFVRVCTLERKQIQTSIPACACKRDKDRLVYLIEKNMLQVLNFLNFINKNRR